MLSSTYLPTCLPTYLPSYLPTYLPTYLHTHIAFIEGNIRGRNDPYLHFMVNYSMADLQRPPSCSLRCSTQLITRQVPFSIPKRPDIKMANLSLDFISLWLSLDWSIESVSMFRSTVFFHNLSFRESAIRRWIFGQKAKRRYETSSFEIIKFLEYFPLFHSRRRRTDFVSKLLRKS